MKITAASAGRARAMRVFVSSTFRDMQGEREDLVKRVFPQLRKICEARGVTWSEVDLRWGVTDEQQAEGRALPICLSEIEHCRPYFLGILGERYGWVPETVPDELLEREPWLRGQSGDSVTEIEIRHGVLNDPGMARYAFFYFRDPAFLETLPAVQRSMFEERLRPEDVARHGAEGAERLAMERREKLATLKQRIRASGVPFRDNYADPHALGELVLHDLTEVIDRVFPPEPEPTHWEREAADHEAFAASRVRVYVARQEYFDRLDAHADGDAPPLVVLGEPGVGKSALIANWVLCYLARQPQASPVVMHFIGASAHSTDLASMLRRLVRELERRFEIQIDVPSSLDALRAAFVNTLHMVGARGRVILVLDDLSKLDDRDGALDLTWLPEEPPRNVRLIVTTLPGRTLQALRQRAWPTLEVGSLTTEQRAKLVEEHLAEYRKRLSPARVARIAEARQTANPLYLRVLLEEVRMFGIHERLDERIAHYLAAENTARLYERVLARYEEDYELGRAGLVRDAMSVLWAARRGLSEAELRDLLGSSGDMLAPAAWSPLYLAAEQSLLSRSGLISFSHDHFRQAVADRYLPSDASRRAAHQRLAEYFGASDFGGRRVEEQPWQLARAGSWDTLSTLLADLPFLDRAWAADPFDVKSYWAEVEAASSWRILRAYGSVLDAPIAHRPHLWTVAKLLEQTGHIAEALTLWSHLSALYRETGDAAHLQATLGNEALLLKALGEFKKALALHEKEQRISLELGRVDEYFKSLSNEARILQVRGELDRALAMYEDCERFCRQKADEHGLQVALGNRATILVARGQLDEAMALFREKERLCRQHGNQDGLCVALLNQAGVFRMRGELDRAMTLLQDQERLCRALGNRDGLQASLGNQALVFLDRSEYDTAMALLQEKARICEAIGNLEELSVALGNQSNVLQAQGKREEAMHVLKEEERLCRDLGNQDGLRASLGRQAIVLFAGGDLAGAMALHKEEERICRKLGHRDGLQYSLGGQALILKHRGERDAAMALHKEQERICRELGNKRALGISLGNQALLLQDRGDFDGAMALHQEKERLCRDLADRKGLQVAIGNQAVILQERGDLDGALELYTKQEALCREIGDRDGLGIALYNQALLFEKKGERARSSKLSKEAARLNSEVKLRLRQRKLAAKAVVRTERGDLDGVISVTRKQARLFRESRDLDGLQSSLWAQAHALYRRGERAAATPLLLEAERLCRESGNKDGLQNSLMLQGMIRLDAGDLDGALPLCKEMETLCRALGNQAGLERALGNQADIFVARTQYDAAMPLLEEQEPLCRLLGRKGALERCLNAQMVILTIRNDVGKALVVCQEHSALCRELGNVPSLAASLFTQATLVGQAFGRRQEGLSLLREAHDLATGHGLAELIANIAALRTELQQPKKGPAATAGNASRIAAMPLEELARYAPQSSAEVLKVMGRILALTEEEVERFNALRKKPGGRR